MGAISAVSGIDLTALRDRWTRWVSGDDGTGRPLVVSPDELLALVAAAEALDEVHEYQCGCDEPGNPAICVAKPEVTFQALAPFAPRGTEETA